MPLTKIEINPLEHFEHLERAPITEAVIEVRARAETVWNEAAVTDRLKEILPDYPQTNLRREVRHTLNIKFGGPERPEDVQSKTDDLGWSGISLRSADERYVAAFHREVFSCSRLKPYETWERLFAETMRLWTVHREIAQPREAQRIGLRFINQIELPAEHFELSDYLVNAPKDPEGLALPFNHFFHHDVLAVPGHPYGANFIRTIQPKTSERGPAVVLDIDVFTTQSVPVESIEQRLMEMRWLKNKLFFGSITTTTVNILR